jgi:decaprenylphospho-beta-D-ribofuranose 2-oxidase
MPLRTVTNWGNYPTLEANFTQPTTPDALREIVATSTPVIARGNGRCYGDSSLGENIISTLRLDRFISFDRDEGIIECQSGTLLSDILDLIVPAGFFLPVTPGTKFITVGGAIAADVHGKNHHRDGNFSAHVVHLDLMTDRGDVVRCSRDENSELFWQTCGGMGLTGVILAAAFRLKRIETAFIDQTSHKAADLEMAFKLFHDNIATTYSVAWIDCFGSRRSVGRSLVLLGEHTLLADLPAELRDEPLRIAANKSIDLPFYFPSGTVNYLSVKALNTLYYHRQFSPVKRSTVHFDGYFYPLDGILNWNRAYGRRGFLQYQCVVPLDGGYDGIKELLEKIGRSGQGSPLAVLKLFGKQDPNAVMSFPMEGYTLALDFKVNDTVFQLLDELDEIVLNRGGRVYLAKDARMSAATFRSSYTKRVASGRFRSAQAERLNL